MTESMERGMAGLVEHRWIVDHGGNRASKAVRFPADPLDLGIAQRVHEALTTFGKRNQGLRRPDRRESGKASARYPGHTLEHLAKCDRGCIR